jgi:hypothetical protein
MTDQQILEESIQRACAGGFKADPEDFSVDDKFIDWEIATGIRIQIGYEQLVYMHNFAKALWGDEEAGIEDFYSPKHNELSGSSWPKMWEYHLQQMVIAEYPIKYLGDNM